MKIHLTIITILTLFLLYGCGKSKDEKSREKLKKENKEELKQEANDGVRDHATDEVQNTNTKNKSVNEIRMKDFTEQLVENADLDYKEKIFYGKAWNDKNGENILVFTEGIETITERNDHGGDEEKWKFFAYHYADDGSGFELKRRIRDFTTCYFLAGKLFKSSVNITDIDEDGKAEITFAYHVGCSPDGASLYPAKVMMLEDGEKYAIRGTTYLEHVKPIGGYETSIGANFKNAPEGFLDFAKKIWQKYRHRNAEDKS
jgi:hypothetical protein